MTFDLNPKLPYRREGRWRYSIAASSLPPAAADQAASCGAPTEPPTAPRHQGYLAGQAGHRASCALGVHFFSADDVATGGSLWKTDGTRDGTVLVASIAGAGAIVGPVAAHGGARIASSTIGAGSTPNCGSATERRREQYTCRTTFIASNLTAVGDILYFSGRTSVWRSDGTVDGTMRRATSIRSRAVHAEPIDRGRRGPVLCRASRCRTALRHRTAALRHARAGQVCDHPGSRLRRPVVLQ